VQHDDTPRERAGTLFLDGCTMVLGGFIERCALMVMSGSSNASISGPVWTVSASGTPAFNRVTLFPFALTLLFRCTARGRLLVCDAQPRDHLRPAVFASSAANGLHLNKPHTKMYLKNHL
jgi:hypothetical protein